LPADLKLCFNSTSRGPAKGQLGAARAAAMIGDMRLREIKYVKCGTRLIRLYEAT